MSVQVKPIPSNENSKKIQVEEMFDDISPKYDFLNHLLSLNIDKIWRKKVCKIINNHKALHVLDIATGTGDLAIALSTIPGLNVIGLDLSEGMLAVARKKVKTKNLENSISLVKGDSESLPFNNAHFQAVTVAFGVRNFENLEKGLTEICRVIADNGIAVVLEFSKPKKSIFAHLYKWYFKRIVPLIGKIFSKNSTAYTYLPASVNAFPEGEEFAQIAKNCGFKSINIQPVTFGIATIYTCCK